MGTQKGGSSSAELAVPRAAGEVKRTLLFGPASAASADEETRKAGPSSADFVAASAGEVKRREVPSLTAFDEEKRGLEP